MKENEDDIMTGTGLPENAFRELGADESLHTCDASRPRPERGTPYSVVIEVL